MRGFQEFPVWAFPQDYQHKTAMSQCGKPIPKALWTYQPLYKTQTIPFEVSFKYPQYFGFIRKRLLQQNPSEPRGKKKRRKKGFPLSRKQYSVRKKKYRSTGKMKNCTVSQRGRSEKQGNPKTLSSLFPHLPATKNSL